MVPVPRPVSSLFRTLALTSVSLLAVGCIENPNHGGRFCSTASPCPSGLACKPDGRCLATCGDGTDCDDHNPCTDDSCDLMTGCAYTNNTWPCDDGNACTDGDQCSSGG